MLFGQNPNPDYIHSAAEIIMNKTGSVKISNDLFIVSEAFFKPFTIEHSHFEIIEEILIYRRRFFVIKIEIEKILLK